MTDRITGVATFCCSYCSTNYSLGEDDFYFESESGSERTMGQEIQYGYEHEQECESCGRHIYIKFEVWEYPVGVLNYTDHSETGAVNVKSEFHIVHVPEEPGQEEENNRVVGAVAGGAILGASLAGPFGALVGGVLGGILGDSVNKSKKEGGHNG